jgi:hypothetical protein
MVGGTATSGWQTEEAHTGSLMHCPTASVCCALALAHAPPRRLLLCWLAGERRNRAAAAFLLGLADGRASAGQRDKFFTPLAQARSSPLPRFLALRSATLLLRVTRLTDWRTVPSFVRSSTATHSAAENNQCPRRYVHICDTMLLS